MNRMSVKIRLASIGVFLAVLAFQPEESFSQANQGKLVQTVPVYEAMLTFPSPIWIKNIGQIDDLKTTQEHGGNSFSLEQIPKEQLFSDWSNLYGVYG